VKCGFEIESVDDQLSRQPEFIARNKRTGEEVAVETKSRHRPGTLHQPGVLPPKENLRADVDRLYNDALGQEGWNKVAGFRANLDAKELVMTGRPGSPRPGRRHCRKP
jgi:hypothetical protein